MDSPWAMRPLRHIREAILCQPYSAASLAWVQLHSNCSLELLLSPLKLRSHSLLWLSGTTSCWGGAWWLAGSAHWQGLCGDTVAPWVKASPLQLLRCHLQGPDSSTGQVVSLWHIHHPAPAPGGCSQWPGGEHCLPSAEFWGLFEEPGRYFKIDSKVQRAESTKPMACLVLSAIDCIFLLLALPLGYHCSAGFHFYCSLYGSFLWVSCLAAKIQSCTANWPSKVSSAYGITATMGWNQAGFFPQLGLIFLCFLMPQSSYSLTSFTCYCWRNQAVTHLQIICPSFVWGAMP